MPFEYHRALRQWLSTLGDPATRCFGCLQGLLVAHADSTHVAPFWHGLLLHSSTSLHVWPLHPTYPTRTFMLSRTKVHTDAVQWITCHSPRSHIGAACSELSAIPRRTPTSPVRNFFVTSATVQAWSADALVDVDITVAGVYTAVTMTVHCTALRIQQIVVIAPSVCISIATKACILVKSRCPCGIVLARLACTFVHIYISCRSTRCYPQICCPELGTVDVSSA